MAVTLKSKTMNGVAAAAAAGVPDLVLSNLQASGHTIEITSNGFAFVAAEGYTNGTGLIVPTDIIELQQLNKGTMSDVDKGILCDKLLFSADVSIKAPAKKVLKGGALDMLPKAPAPHVAAEPAQPVAKPADSGEYGTYDIYKMTGGTRISLKMATKLYQPVHGTSAGSRYYLIAANPDIRVAARYQGGALSFRIEGPGLAKYLERIQEVGFSKTSAEYASMHLATQHNDILAAKAMGAVLMGLGMPMLTPFPELKIIQNK